jgi:uncharacterized protein YdaT
MPWKLGDALRYTKSAASPKKKKQWTSVANAVLNRSGDEGKAIRIANSQVKKARSHKKKVT